MKFLHLADVHIGCWRAPELKELSSIAFEETIRVAISEDVDFVVIAGDLFHTAIPSIDLVKRVVRSLQELKQAGIPMYFIAGSHDFSPTGKTMLDVIEEAELGKNVMKGDVEDGELQLRFTEDPGTGVKLTGIIGQRGMLDRNHYEALDKEPLEEEPGKKLFLFHTAITELKPDELQRMESSPTSFLPKGFTYYPGGHVHIVKDTELGADYQNVVYPGPLFPTNFRELEKLGRGSYYVYDDGDLEQRDIRLKDVVTITEDLGMTTPDKAQKALEETVREATKQDSIVTLRVEGTITNGSLADINFQAIQQAAYDEDAYFFMKNTSKLRTEDFTEVEVHEQSTEELENRLIKEHLGQVQNPFGDEFAMTKQLMITLGSEQNEGEKKSEYEERVLSEADAVLREDPSIEDLPEPVQENEVEAEKEDSASSVQEEKVEEKKEEVVEAEEPEKKRSGSTAGTLSSFLETE